MSHVGIICPASTGHLNPMMTVASELQRRGHQVLFYQVADTESKIRRAGFEHRVIGLERFPPGRLSQDLKQLGQLSGSQALQLTIQLILDSATIHLNEIPSRARNDGIDALIVDETCHEGGTVAAALGIPFVTVSNALILLEEGTIPPFFTMWPYQNSPLARARNALTYFAFNRKRKAKRMLINRYRRDLGLAAFAHLDQACSERAHLSQQPREFDFPRLQLPAHVHFVGPLHDATVRESCSFPFEALSGAPLVYASMGTLQNRQQDIFGCLADACADLPVQLVISLGGGSQPAALGQLGGHPVVVEYAPQLQLLERATVCITHGGLNTVLECLAQGVPMLAIPIANDQPGVCSRLVWTGAGEAIRLKDLSAKKVREALTRLLTNRGYAQKAAEFRDIIRTYGGARTAADVIEGVIRSAQESRRANIRSAATTTAGSARQGA